MITGRQMTKNAKKEGMDNISGRSVRDDLWSVLCNIMSQYFIILLKKYLLSYLSCKH